MKTLLACIGTILSFLAALSTLSAFAAGFVFHQLSGTEVIYPFIILLSGAVLFFCIRWELRKNSLLVGVVLFMLGLLGMYGGVNNLVKLSASYSNPSDAYLLMLARERASILAEGLRLVGGKVAISPTLLEDSRRMMTVNLVIAAVLSGIALLMSARIIRKHLQQKKAERLTASPAAENAGERAV